MLAASLTAGVAAAPAPPPTVAQALRDARYGLRLTDGKLGGEGAPVLRQALGEARYIAVGEDHFTREVPAFVAALCDTLTPQGLGALALEVGPVAAAALGPILSAGDRLPRMKRFVARYPNAVAFLDSRADNDMAAHCRAAAPSRALPIIGLDQDYIGSAGMVLDAVLAEPLPAPARAAVQALRDEERSAAVAAAQTGDPARLLLLSIAPAKLDAVAATLARGAGPRARWLFGELRESAAIYALNARGDPAANTRRATLLKRHFVRFAPPSGKILLKFGDWHLYKGVNPLGNLDLGNFITETADGRGERSLHILVLGARGQHATFAGYARPPGRAPFVMTDDPDYHWLQPAVDQQVDGAWTMFDLRRLRHRRLASLDPEWQRVIAGYDLMVLVPVLTPSDTIGAPAPG